MKDIFVPDSQAQDGLVGPLHTVTYLTAEPEVLHTTLTDGLLLEAVASLEPGSPDRAALADYLGLPASDGAARCYNAIGPGRNVQVRALGVPATAPLLRPAVDGAYVGGLSIGFPMQRIPEHEARMRTAGASSTVGLKELEFQSPQGDVYVSGEIHFAASENVFLLGVQRPDVFIPVGPMDAATGIGGPAYSARCVADGDRVRDFFVAVMDYECRRDMAMTIGPRSGLRMDEGGPERFLQLFAPGARTGYAVLLDHADGRKLSAAPTQGPPSRGMVMWSFPTTALDEVVRRAKAHGGRVRHAPAERASPFLPATRTAIVEDPDGFPLEFFETASSQ